MKRLIICLACLALPSLVDAANPAQVAAGLQLFNQEFVTTAPGLSGDGLGPVFNEASCVACHNAGGVGGSGDASKNARSLGLNEAIYRRPEQPELVTAAFQQFSPGFVSSNGTVTNSFPLHRRGGSDAMKGLRNQSMSLFNRDWNDDDSLSSDSIHAEREPKTISSPDGILTLKVQVFARNTTPLFGTGLIDQIPESAVWQLARLQQRDGEVSGRPGTLADGRIGKFGWRANFASLLEFNENACSAELGLQSKRVPQPVDLMNRNYVNANPDITDDAIVAMNSFVASLPRPHREMPQDSRARAQVDLGQQRFTAIGCSKCHVPSLGGVADLYSDLLLHDMGPYSVDFASAPAYSIGTEVANIELSRTESTTTRRTTESFQEAGSYYGMSWPAGMVTRVEQNSTTKTSGVVPISPSYTNKRVTYIEPKAYPPKRKVQILDAPVTATYEETESGQDANTSFARRTTTNVTTQWMQETTYEPTLINQEWKTPPLWGVRDSAPYMHDGRAESILEAIAMHDGEGRGSRNRFLALSYDDQQAVLAFIDTFVAPTEGVIEAPKKFTRRDLAAR